MIRRPPEIDHYAVVHGARFLVGRYTAQIRQDYVNYRAARYLLDHPKATRSEAGKAARQAWRVKALASIERPIA